MWSMFILYLDFTTIRDVQQAETKKGKHKIKQKYNDNNNTEQNASLIVLCVENKKINFW